jgi:hypothetical protein
MLQSAFMKDQYMPQLKIAIRPQFMHMRCSIRISRPIMQLRLKSRFALVKRNTVFQPTILTIGSENVKYVTVNFRIG